MAPRAHRYTIDKHNKHSNSNPISSLLPSTLGVEYGGVLSNYPQSKHKCREWKKNPKRKDKKAFFFPAKSVSKSIYITEQNEALKLVSEQGRVTGITTNTASEYTSLFHTFVYVHALQIHLSKQLAHRFFFFFFSISTLNSALYFSCPSLLDVKINVDPVHTSLCTTWPLKLFWRTNHFTMLQRGDAVFTVWNVCRIGSDTQPPDFCSALLSLCSHIGTCRR